MPVGGRTNSGAQRCLAPAASLRPFGSRAALRRVRSWSPLKGAEQRSRGRGFDRGLSSLLSLLLAGRSLVVHVRSRRGGAASSAGRRPRRAVAGNRDELVVAAPDQGREGRTRRSDATVYAGIPGIATARLPRLAMTKVLDSRRRGNDELRRDDDGGGEVGLARRQRAPARAASACTPRPASGARSSSPASRRSRWRRGTARCASVSTPSATTFSCSACAIVMTACAIGASSWLPAGRSTNERSILSESIGKALEIGQARIAGAEVVDRDAARRAPSGSPASRAAASACVHRGALGDLDLEQVRRRRRTRAARA